ncbi:unnamed protein product [Vitrella brassicaformis CCMP3155]|uniref:Glycosyl transferase 64 domain-containing protein n=1 Tax=Vitrella brassicaformis (strain CCMP3155) TaxID=1169540 RepID=A0A0G4FJW3_VITBC|nr:unnamed protein product [Vitrella brassicaformis CCMP3155]|eukprot:CEM14057.1 unnamed protein product [Vitrella brassicaformis CCMP3155]
MGVAEVATRIEKLPLQQKCFLAWLAVVFLVCFCLLVVQPEPQTLVVTSPESLRRKKALEGTPYSPVECCPSIAGLENVSSALQPEQMVDSNKFYTVTIFTIGADVEMLRTMTRRIGACDKIDRILILWNTAATPPEPSFLAAGQFADRIVVVQELRDSLQNRFLLVPAHARTEGIVSIDDDMTGISCEELDGLFDRWRDAQQCAVVGPTVRTIEGRGRAAMGAGATNPYLVSVGPQPYRLLEYVQRDSRPPHLILTNVAIYSRCMAVVYSHVLPRFLIGYVDTLMNCEDILFNFMLHSFTSGVRVKASSHPDRLHAPREQRHNRQRQSISLKDKYAHQKKRDACVMYFTRVLGDIRQG